MTEVKKKALDVLDNLLSEGGITDEDYSALSAGLQEGAPWGDSGMLYDVFLVDGPFGDEDAPLVRLNEVDCLELGTLLRIAMRQDFDMVVRRGEESEE